MSDDFLKFANDRFDQRYPSAQDRVMKWHVEEDRFQDFPVDNLVLYDDVLCQLDDVATERFGCLSASILMRGAINLETYPSRAMFHCNHHASLRFDHLQSVLNADPNCDQLANQFAKQKDSLWNFKYLLMWIPETVEVQYAKNYVYPVWEEAENKMKRATLMFRNWLPNFQTGGD